MSTNEYKGLTDLEKAFQYVFAIRQLSQRSNLNSDTTPEQTGFNLGRINILSEDATDLLRAYIQKAKEEVKTTEEAATPSQPIFNATGVTEEDLEGLAVGILQPRPNFKITIEG